MKTALILKLIDQREQLKFARQHYKPKIQEEELKVLLALLEELGSAS